MDLLISIGQFLYSNRVLELSVLLGMSELLGSIPAIKANSVFQLLVQLISKLKPSS